MSSLKTKEAKPRTRTPATSVEATPEDWQRRERNSGQVVDTYSTRLVPGESGPSLGAAPGARDVNRRTRGTAEAPLFVGEHRTA
eukprot:7615038-Alexandrium_andersonii.AAC.1